MSDGSAEHIDRLIAIYERLRRYHTPAVLLLILAALVNFRVELPAVVWVVFMVYFGLSLTGNMAKQRRKSEYA